MPGDCQRSCSITSTSSSRGLIIGIENSLLAELVRGLIGKSMF
jgi:hypothetical protein